MHVKSSGASVSRTQCHGDEAVLYYNIHVSVYFSSSSDLQGVQRWEGIPSDF